RVESVLRTQFVEAGAVWRCALARSLNGDGMYAAPQVLVAEVFARYPDELRTGRKESEWNQGQPANLASSSFLEGPSFDRDGVLWCVDVVNGRVLNVDPDGAFSVAVEYDGWPNGLKIRDDGLVFIADYKNGILVHEPGSKA